MPTETYEAGMNATCQVNGTAISVEDCSYTVEQDVDEMTNNQSGGWHEDVGTIKKANGSIKAIYRGTSPPAFDAGDIVTLAIALTSGPGISGNARVKKVSKKLTVKGGVKYDFDWTSQGAMTITK